MADTDLIKQFNKLAEAFFMTQGQNFAIYDILLDFTANIAADQSNPSAFLKAMFERISAKIDNQPIETERKTASAWRRETIATFFSVAERNAVHRAASRKDDEPGEA
jgi:hypothetical protein